MKLIPVLLLTALTAFSATVNVSGYGSVRVESKEAVKGHVREFNRYDRSKLLKLAEDKLDGIIDTTLATKDMIKLFVNTSKCGKDVKLAFNKTPPHIGGFYRPADSLLVVSTDCLKDKELALYVVVHELTHSLQMNNQFYTFGRKSVIVNELFADYVASIYADNVYGRVKYRQTVLTLGRYLDGFFESPNRMASKYRYLSAAHEAVTDWLKRYHNVGNTTN